MPEIVCIMRPHKYTTLFFDLDNTLWDFNLSTKETFQEIFEINYLRKQGVPSIEHFMSYYKGHNELLWSHYRDQKIEKAELSYKRFDLTLNDFGIFDTGLAKKMASDYILISPEKTKLYSDTLEVLDILKPHFKMLILTNGFEEIQTERLKRTGLAPYFHEMITAEKAKALKPHPGIFEFAFKAAESKAKECIMIGDDLEADVKGAQNAQIDSIWIHPKAKETANTATFSINKLTELPSLLLS